MAKIIAVCNQKGGVGKTTTSLNLGAALALSGNKVLLIDLDPQANATGGLGIDKEKVYLSVYQLLLEETPTVKEAILTTKVTGLFLIPSQVALSGAEIELVSVSGREEKLKKILSSLCNSYDFILIDCPPSLGLLTINAMNAANAVLIPLQCEYYALEGLSQLLETIELVQKNLNPELCIEGILLTMADFRTKLTHDVIDEVRRYFGSKVYDVVISRSVRLSEAPSHGLPIALYDPTSSGAQAYHSLAQKIKENQHVRDTWIGQRDSGSDSGKAAGDSGNQGGSHPNSNPVNPAEPISAPTRPE